MCVNNNTGISSYSSDEEWLHIQSVEAEKLRLKKLMDRKFVHIAKPFGLIYQAGIATHRVGINLYSFYEYRGINNTYWEYPPSLEELFNLMQKIAPLHMWQES